jgi:Phage protein Gp138 N-terminal domain
MPLQVTLPMVLDAHADARMQDTHTSVPATIVSWSASTQTATVQPMIRKPIPSADGFLTYETPPQIQNVPCYVQRGGGYLVSVPFNAGDPVWLMFSEQSYAEYLSTGQVSSPRDLRRHGTGYPFAIPGTAPASLALQSVASDALVIGRDGQDELITIEPGLIQAGATGTQFVALANLVASELSKISSALSAVAAGGGSTVTGVNTYTSPGNVAGTLFKTK